MVRVALEQVFDDNRIELLRQRLREKLAGGVDGELLTLRKQRDRLNRTAQHLLRLICQSEASDTLLDAEYARTKAEVRAVERQIKALEAASAEFGRRDIEAQLKVDPSELIDKLLDGTLPAERLRAVLSQLFPRFVFVGRDSRFVANFEINFAPGVAIAWLSGTSAALDDTIIMKVKLIGSARRPVEWKTIVESIKSTSEEARGAVETAENTEVPSPALV